MSELQNEEFIPRLKVKSKISKDDIFNSILNTLNEDHRQLKVSGYRQKSIGMKRAIFLIEELKTDFEKEG